MVALLSEGKGQKPLYQKDFSLVNRTFTFSLIATLHKYHTRNLYQVFVSFYSHSSAVVCSLKKYEMYKDNMTYIYRKIKLVEIKFRNEYI